MLSLSTMNQFQQLRGAFNSTLPNPVVSIRIWRVLLLHPIRPHDGSTLEAPYTQIETSGRHIPQMGYGLRVGPLWSVPESPNNNAISRLVSLTVHLRNIGGPAADCVGQRPEACDRDLRRPFPNG